MTENPIYNPKGLIPKNPNVEHVWNEGALEVRNGKYSADSSSGKLVFIVRGVFDETQAINLAFSSAPDKIYNPDDSNDWIFRNSATIEERLSESDWKVSVAYNNDNSGSFSSSKDDDDAISESEVCFQCSNTTMHVQKALDQEEVFRREGVTPVYNTKFVPIGWNGKFGLEFQADGVDVPIAECREQYTRVLRYSKVRSSSWRRRVAECVGKVNNGSFKGWKKGEAMFLGASYTTAQGRDVEKVKVTFEFLIRLNESDATVVGRKIGKLEGHEYAWVVTGNVLASNQVSPVVDRIFKARVCSYANFDNLGI